MSQAKPSFQSNQESIEAGDYILKKKVQATKCVASLNQCVYIPLTPVNRYKYNLNMNLFTTLDLTSVEVVEDSVNKESPTTINKAVNFYNRYVIDPKGQLFGNTRCGYKNFLMYLKNNN
jgi:hypothetical protein